MADKLKLKQDVENFMANYSISAGNDSVLSTQAIMSKFEENRYKVYSIEEFGKLLRWVIPNLHPNAAVHRTRYWNGYRGIAFKDLPLNQVPAKDAPKLSKIYVLKFADGATPAFYVGKSKDVEERLQQHAAGQGAACTTGRQFTRVEPTTIGSAADLEAWERAEVLARMHEFGIGAVRGWKFTMRFMPLSQRLAAFDDVCERLDLCRECGRGTHFVEACEAVTTDRWTNGLQVRSSYGRNLLAAAGDEMVEEERALRAEAEQAAERERALRAETEQRVASAMRVLGGGMLLDG
jgi:hypothetical protein